MRVHKTGKIKNHCDNDVGLVELKIEKKKKKLTNFTIDNRFT